VRDTLRALVFLWAALAAAFALAQASPVAQPSAEDARAIRAVVEEQLAAFKVDDGEKAFSYAAPVIRERFRTAAAFMDMVRDGYAPLYRPRMVEFLSSAIIEGDTVQAVRVVGQDGDVKVALYFMERQADGSWKIKAVELAPATAVSA
jgi:ketosteroid isomerase-like protein